MNGELGQSRFIVHNHHGFESCGGDVRQTSVCRRRHAPHVEGTDKLKFVGHSVEGADKLKFVGHSAEGTDKLKFVGHSVEGTDKLKFVGHSLGGVNEMAEGSVEERVKQIIVDELGVDEGEVTPNARFIDDLGADSLDTVELVMRFEEEFNIEIPDEDAEKIQSVRDAIDYIEKHSK